MHLESLRELCLSFPAVTEDVKWEHDLCFSVGGKMFCVASLEPPLTFSLKVTEEEFEELIALPGIVPAPYLARYKWIFLENPLALPLERTEQLVKQSYQLISGKLSKKERKTAGLL
ncbi:MmcQ/YjbR family DNA-binding protein [Rufibacter sediminis]|uniref:MmcQ/YjbR family DNA-binding protein n=1 Tax=Rufibacter sediminis TaxID=2762756 RepID=A0ABR6VUG4_9BACT|nr:MmcQ/YjbR family DNA-binding protein [Rufibacter sediminis]MBC3540261.1 MmcQ/YjbR family DNA-binding protein [Rufibacter sediminis]